jgi:beta-N-acetylhexosaminidase
MHIFKISIKIFILLIIISSICIPQSRKSKYHKKNKIINRETTEIVSIYNSLQKDEKHNWNYKEVHKKYGEKIKNIISYIPLKVKLGQIFISWPSISNHITQINQSGVIFSSSHIPSTEKAASIADEYNKKSLIPLFFAVDQEGGKVNRLKRIDEYQDLPSAMEIGLWSTKKIKEYSDFQGKILKKMSININFAPVVDISIDGFMFETQRSFSADPELVTKAAESFTSGMISNNILCIAKHFPGYGNSVENSDLAVVYSDLSKDSINMYINIFKQLKNKVHGVMMSHIIYRSEDNAPASVSAKLIKKAKAINPEWLIISDFIESQAIMDFNNNNLVKAIINTFINGNDLIVSNRSPKKIEKYIEEILPSIIKNKRFNSRLDESIEKILILKEMIYPGLIDLLYTYLEKKH